MRVSDALPEGHRPGSPELRRTSLALFAAAVGSFGLLHSPQPILPLLADDFGIGAGRSALAISLSTATLAVGVLVAAPLSDRFGRTPLIRGALVISTALGLACALAPTWPVLEVLRALLGMSLAGLIAVAVAYLREELHPAAGGPAIALYVGGNALGGMAGRLLAAGLADVWGWRAGLAGVALVAALATVVAWRLLPTSRRFVPATAGLRALGRRTTGVLADPALLALYGLAFALMGAFFTLWNPIAFRLQSPEYGLSAGAAGLVVVLYALGSVSSARAGRLAARRGRRSVVLVAVLVLAGGVALTLATPLALVVAGMAVATIGFFAAHGVSSGWVAVRAAGRGRSAGQASSLYLVGYYLGASAGGGIGGVAWEQAGWSGVVLAASVFLVLAAALTVALSRTRNLSAAPERPGRPDTTERPDAPSSDS